MPKDANGRLLREGDKVRYEDQMWTITEIIQDDGWTTVMLEDEEGLWDETTDFQVELID